MTNYTDTNPRDATVILWRAREESCGFLRLRRGAPLGWPRFSAAPGRTLKAAKAAEPESREELDAMRREF